MGWWGHYRKCGETVKEFIAREYASEEYPIIKIAIKNFNVAYILRQSRETEEIFACVYLLRYEKNNEIMIKTMDEFHHPYYYDIPEKMFWKLTPSMDNSNGRLAWRGEVLRRIEKKREVKKMKIGEGSILRFKKTLTFTNGFKADTFRLEKRFNGKGWIFRSKDSSIGYAIPNWKKREFEILTEEVTA